ncbi:phage shock protein A [Evansella caseinilytica]|uniref:Phage shock protein A n=1 Tax=Evansella caseinilytica TaxID=1503961 RepID=A0A1H3HDY2_9BACI|nr:PspA/IM30 family protein [Evansella caseinilytica]SDY13671.1 phage shock protein A [Evansella caseinilytica]
MSIIQRFKTIMASNINTLLDKADNPEKLVDQYLKELAIDFGKVKSEMTAMQMNKQRLKRQLDEYRADSNRMQLYAVKALENNEEEEARKFLEKKAALTDKAVELQNQYDGVCTSTEQMQQMYEKLAGDIRDLEARRNLLKGRAAAARTKGKLSETGSSLHHTMSTFNRMEDDVNRALYEAEALAKLRSGSAFDIDDEFTEIAEKEKQGNSVEDELALLKKQVNKDE